MADSAAGDPAAPPPVTTGRRPPRRRIGPEGEVIVEVLDEQDDHPVDVVRWQALAAAVLVGEGVAGDAELSLLFVDETTMAGLNAQFMGADGPTDVLSFPIDGELVEPGRSPDGSPSGPDRHPIPIDDLPLLLGDVVVCPAVAARNAPDHAGTVDDELALLVVHGVLHVLGHDHALDDDRDRMWDRERALLAAHHGALARDPWAS
jgi:probable rRNA maturation factor